MSEAALSSNEAYHGTRREQKGKVTDRLLAFIESDNIAKDLSEEELNRLGERVTTEYQVDKTSRNDWEMRTKDAMDLALQVVDEKNYPWPKASNVKFPLLTTAAIQFAARAYPAIISGRDVVRGVVIGPDEGIPDNRPQPPAGGAPGPVPGMASGPMQQGAVETDPEASNVVWMVPPGAKKERADRIARHMSWQLLDEMEDWEEDTDQLLHILSIVGTVFRKTWFDPHLGRNRSELITADNLVFNYKGKFEQVPRHTQVFKLYPHEIEERIRLGLFLDFETGITGDPNDEQSPHEFYEQHRWDDLDEDGYPEPYIVTVHKDTNTVVRIVARYDEDGVLLNDKDEVVKIEPIRYFTQFIFMPSPDGGNMGIGFGALLRPMNDAINAAINQMLDAGHLQNTGGGFIGYGLKIKGGVHAFRPGEYKRVESIAGSIRDNVVPLDFRGPSTVLFQLLGLLIEAGRDISSVKDVMTGGEGPSNEAASRTLARIEQGMKVFSAIHKRVFRSLRKEYRKIARLNRLYLPDQQYFEFHDTPEAVAREDYAQEDLDVAPAADPNMVTDVQKMAQAEFLMQFRGDPGISQVENNRRIFQAVGISDLDDLILEELPPNPEIAMKADEIEIKKKDQEIKMQELGLQSDEMVAKVAEIQSKIILNLAKAEEASDKAEIQGLAALLKTITDSRKMEIEARRADSEDEERRLRRVEGQSGDGAGAGASA